MLPVELPVAIRADDQQPLLRREAHDVAQHRDRAAVSPVEVVEHQHERRPHRRGEEELRAGAAAAGSAPRPAAAAPARRCPAAAPAGPARGARSAARIRLIRARPP